MAEERAGTERAIRWTTILSVVVLAMIAAVVSYKHTYLLVRQYGSGYAVENGHRLSMDSGTSW